MSQTTLTEGSPLILDASCGYGRFWPRFATIRIDIRAEVRPDILMDSRNLKFPNAYFDEIYYDPPHLFRKSDNLERLRQVRRFTRRFGPLCTFDRYEYWHTRREWPSSLHQSMKEFHRCLKPNGRLRVKLTEGKYMLVDDLDNQGFEIEKHRTTTSRAITRTAMVHWLILKPKPCQKQIV